MTLPLREQVDKILRSIHNGMDVNTPIDPQNNTLFMIACAMGYIDVVRSLLHQERLSMDLTNREGNNALIMAVQNRHADIIELLLRYRSIDINHVNQDGVTALMFACLFGPLEIVKMLVQNGADVHHTDRYGFTPLLLAIASDQRSIIGFLLQKGADINQRNVHNGYTPLLWVCTNPNSPPDMVNYLLKNGANVDAMNRNGETALLLAAAMGNDKKVKILLEYDPDVNGRDIRGNTALSLASQYGHADVVRRLLSHPRIRPDLRNDGNRTAQQLGSSWKSVNRQFEAFHRRKLLQNERRQDDRRRVEGPSPPRGSQIREDIIGLNDEVFQKLMQMFPG